MDNTVQNFFTPSSIATLAGASIAVIAVSNTLRVVFKLDSLLPCFITSLLVSLIGSYTSESLNGFVDFVLAIINGFLLFSNAAGIQESVIKASQPKQLGKVEVQGKYSIKWFSTWFRKN